MSVPAIILDTDLDTDCDDVGAIALLHALRKAGECRLLGVVCSAPVAECAATAQVLNAWFGQPGLPVAAVRVGDAASAPAWQGYREHRARFLAGGHAYHAAVAACPPPRPAGVPVEEAVACYRRLLAAAAPGSLTIAAIGTLTALAQLLASGPDAHSPLTGVELVRRQVRELVSMAAGTWPEGVEEFNWRMDLPSAAAVLAAWPGALTVSPHGRTVVTGARFMAALPAGHPARAAYRAFLGGEGRDRPSWDQITALYAVRGLAGPFARGADQGLELDPVGGRHRWRPDPGAGPRRLVVPLIDDQRLAALVEELMIAGAC